MMKANALRLSREAVAAASLMNVSPLTPAHKKSQRLPFHWVLHSASQNIPFLMQHPEAPPPLQLFAVLSQHYCPDPADTARLLQRHKLDGCGKSLRIVTRLLLPSKNGASPSPSTPRCRHHWLEGRLVQNALLQLLLHRGLMSEAAELFMSARCEDISPELWSDLVLAAATKKLRHSQAIWKLMSMENFPITPATGTGVARSSSVRDSDTWTGGGRARRLPGTSALVTREKQEQQQFDYALTAERATQLLDAAGLSLSYQASPVIALETLRRYTHSAKAYAQWISPGTSPSSSRIVPISPQPFLVFFMIAKDASDRQTGLPLLHWQVVWQQFQFLNKHCPTWYEQCGAATEVACKYVVEVLVRGADPWLTLNVCRALARRHIVDGVAVSVWLLQRIDPSHHPAETREITANLFTWLMDVVGVHLLPDGAILERVVRSLLRLEQYDELGRLYNTLVDNFFDLPEKFRQKILDILADLVCPSCSSMLRAFNMYEERTCQVCMASVAPKDIQELPSFALSKETVKKIRDARKQKNKESRGHFRKPYGKFDRSSGSSSSGGDAPSLTPEQDAASRLKKEVLEAPLFIPGEVDVRTAPARQLFTLTSRSSDESSDIRSAMEEQKQKLARQQQVRRLALKQRGIENDRSDGLRLTSGAAGSASAVSHSLPTDFSFSGLVNDANRNAAIEAHPRALLESKWTCVWCLEENGESASRTTCRACGAETGPLAPWRTFPSSSSSLDNSSAKIKFDIMSEIRTRILISENRPEHAVIAAYNLMVYRRTFLLRAMNADFKLVETLVLRLVQTGQKILAGFLFMRLIPPKLRKMNDTVLELGRAFGCIPEDELRRVTDDTLCDERRAFNAIFSDSTCRACFGAHSWVDCPMVSRDFTKTSVKPTIDERGDGRFSTIHNRLSRLIRSATTPDEVRVAYHTFLRSQQREAFAQLHHEEANRLASLLCQFNDYVRAAFVVCHIPYPARQNTTYIDIASWYGVSSEDCKELLNKRSSAEADDDSHPNFVQVALTCCICLDGQHASFKCHFFEEWYNLAIVAQKRPKDGETMSSSALQLNENEAYRLHSRLLALVDGWTMSGPERLHAFYRFLIEHIEDYSELKVNNRGAAFYGLNKCIAKLAITGKRAYAFRLYARSPAEFISGATLAEVLRLRNVSDDVIFKCRAESVVDPKWRATAIPEDCCLVCFQPDHTLYACPEVQAARHPLDALHYVVSHVGGIRCSSSGAVAACAYLNQVYQFGLLHVEALRARPQLVQWIIRVAEKCFALRYLTIGTRTMRRLHMDLIPMSLYSALWTAAELTPEQSEQCHSDLTNLFARFGLKVLEDVTQATLTPRATLPNEFFDEYGNIVFRHVCRHCFEPNHQIEHCSTFAQEVSFSRDILSVYRSAMTLQSDKVTDDFTAIVLAKLCKFLIQHAPHLPVYIFGVHRAVNAIACSLATVNAWIGPSLRVLLALPPAYRAEHVPRIQLHTRIMNHIENDDDRLDEIDRRLDNVKLWSPKPDPVTKAFQSQPLIEFRNPEHDDLFSKVFADLPDVDLMMVHADGLVLKALEVGHRIDEKAYLDGMTSTSSSPSSEAGAAVDASIIVDQARRRYPKISPLQVSSIGALRDMFDPIMCDVEKAVGRSLGSRVNIFQSEVVEHLSSSPAPPPEGQISEPQSQQPRRQTIVVESTPLSSSPSSGGPGKNEKPALRTHETTTADPSQKTADGGRAASTSPPPDGQASRDANWRQGQQQKQSFHHRSPSDGNHRQRNFGQHRQDQRGQHWQRQDQSQGYQQQGQVQHRGGYQQQGQVQHRGGYQQRTHPQGQHHSHQRGQSSHSPQRQHQQQQQQYQQQPADYGRAPRHDT